VGGGSERRRRTWKLQGAISRKVAFCRQTARRGEARRGEGERAHTYPLGVRRSTRHHGRGRGRGRDGFWTKARPRLIPYR
jgi:hypothetical protein